MPTVETRYFDYGPKEIDYLSSVDEALGTAIRRIGKVERTVMPDLFQALAYAIVAQLISTKAVHTIWGRMQERLGAITPTHLAEQSADVIQSCGMTMKKALCLKNIAQSIAQGDFNLAELPRMSDAEVISKLMTLNGVGRWTAEMLLLHSLERPDVISWGDIAIRRGMMKLYGLNEMTKEQFEQYRRSYSPYGSVASIYLWEISSE